MSKNENNYKMFLQWAGILFCEVRQVDISKVNEQHPYGLFRCVQAPAEKVAAVYRKALLHN